MKSIYHFSSSPLTHTQKEMDKDWGQLKSLKYRFVYFKACGGDRWETVTTGTIMIMIIIIIASRNSTLSFQHLRFLHLPFLRKLENAWLLPHNGVVMPIQLSSPSHSTEVKRWHFGLLFKRVNFLSLSLQEKQLIKLMQCTGTNALEVPQARQS